MARLLLLIPTTSYRVGDFLKAAARVDVDVVVASDQPPVLAQYAAGRTVTVDFTDLRAGTGQVTAFAGDYPLSAILGVDDGTTVLAAMASEALGLMNERAITNLFVVSDQRPVGIVHIHDCLRAGVA